MSFRPQRSRFLVSGSLITGVLVAAFGLAVATAQTTVPDNGAPAGGEAEGDESGGLFSGGLLPNGSILRNVVLPSYDAERNMVSSVKAGDLTIFTREEDQLDRKTHKAKTVTVLDKVKINDLRISFFNTDRTNKGNIAMSHALLTSAAKKQLTLLTSEEPVSFVSDDLKVDGSALAFDTKNNRGFLHGPVTAVARTIDKRTSMNASPAQRALAAGALMMASIPALPAQERAAAPAAAPSPAPAPSVTTAQRFGRSLLTQAELDEAAKETATRAPQQVAETDAAGKDLKEVTAKSEDARVTMNGFLQAAALASMLAEPAPAALPDVPRPPVFNDPQGTVVKSKNGAYFDSKEGLLIFLGDVTVKNPQLDLKGASEVKLFMEPEKKEEKKDEAAAKPKEGDPAAATPDAPKEGPKEITPEMAAKMLAAKEARMAEGLKKAGGADKGGEGGSFGDIKRMVATGPAVHIRFDSGKPGDKPVEASAHSIIYDFEKEQMLLQGGSPWVYQEGGMQGQAKGATAYILIHTDGEGNLTKVVTHNPDGFEMDVKTPPKKDDPKNQKPKQDKPKQEQPNR